MKELFTLGKLNVSDFLPMEDGILHREPKKYELKLAIEETTGAIRLTDCAPLDSMYGKYWYRSGINQTMKDELKNVVDSILKVTKLKENDIWLDIACNDGTMFDYIPDNIIKIGIDPADDSYKEESEKKADLIIQDFFSYKTYSKSKFGKMKAKVISIIAMFYDLDKPDPFLQDVNKVLDDDGLLVMQMSYTPLMLKQLAFDNICFKPDTMIGYNNISNIKIGDEVLGENGENVKVLNIFERDYDGDIYNIKAEYLDSLEPTPEHPVKIVRKENITSLKKEWVKAENLNIGDYLVIPKIKTKIIDKKLDLIKYNKIESSNHRRGLMKLELTEDVLWMMGLYVAEGYISGPENNLQINFSLHQKETNFIDKLEKIFNSLGYKIKNRERDDSLGTNVSVCCTSLSRLFKDWFGEGALNKKIPYEIMYSDKDSIISFLKGIIDYNEYLNFHISSKVLMYQFQLLLAKLNIMVNVTRIGPQKRIIRERDVISKESWVLRGSSRIISEIFGTKGKKNNKLRYYFDDDFIYVRIKKITKEKYIGKVHNIETENNTYIVSNAIVHNCHEHIYYYSLFNMKIILNRNGFEVVDCQLNDINGGSFRVYAKKKGFENSFHTQPYRDVCNFRINSLLEYEKTLKLYNEKTWTDFFDRINKLKEQTVSFIKSEKAKGKTIWGYGACHDSKTRLVTENGIKTFDEINMSDKVYTLNHNTNDIELSSINEIMIYPYEGDMIHFYGKRIDMMVTPNHNMLFQTEHSSKCRYEIAEKIINRERFSIPRGRWNGLKNNNKIIISDFVDQDSYSNKCRKIQNEYDTSDFLYLLGLFVGDGYVSNQKGDLSIKYCIPRFDKARKKLIDTLGKMNLIYREYDNEIHVASQALRSIFLECEEGALNKRIPRWALEYAPIYLRCILDGLIDSDGWYESNNRERFSTSSFNLVKDVVELSIKLGYFPSFGIRKEQINKPKIRGREIKSGISYIINIGKRQPVCYNREIYPTVKEKYKGVVWCLSVENKNFLVERNGKIAFSGNSTKGNTTLQYFGLDNTLIDGIAERSPYKWGLKTSGTNIPIYSEDEMRRANPDYLLILPWHFINEFKEREKDFLIGGGKFIVPCPKFEVIGY